MQETYGQFNQREDKTVAKWDFSIPCKEGSTQQRSTKVYYAESGCTQETCVDFITKPCYDNIYRFDGFGESSDPDVTLQSEADAEWLEVLPYLPRFVLRTLANGVLQMRAIYPDGTFDNRTLNPPPVDAGLGATWPASLQARRLVLFEFDAALLARMS
jgi:hypothetical protein